MQLLEIIKAEDGAIKLTDLAHACGLSKSTTHHILDTLIGTGHVMRMGTKYGPGPRLLPLAPQQDTPMTRLRNAFTPALRAFADMTGENCFLAIPGGTRTYLTLDALNGRNQTPLRLPPNDQRDALLTSAVGKIFLANDQRLVRRLRREQVISQPLERELTSIHQQGYALDIGASEQGLNCVALPLRLRGSVVAALSASGPASELRTTTMRRFATKAMQDLFNLIKC